MAPKSTPVKPKKNLASVKQTFHTSIDLNKRILQYCNTKGLRPSQIFVTAVDSFLNNNNF